VRKTPVYAQFRRLAAHTGDLDGKACVLLVLLGMTKDFRGQMNVLTNLCDFFTCFWGFFYLVMGFRDRVCPGPLSHKVNDNAVLIYHPARSFVTHRCLAGLWARWCSLHLFLPGAGVTSCSPSRFVHQVILPGEKPPQQYFKPRRCKGTATRPNASHFVILERNSIWTFTSKFYISNLIL
jgi:hypothetical protein